MIPYRLSEHTASIFPMKVFEYLAAGLRVVTTPLPALATVADLPVERAESDAAFAAALAAPHEGLAHRRSAFAAQHTWDVLLTTMAAALPTAPQAGPMP